MESTDVPLSIQTEEATEQSFGSLSEMSNFDSSSDIPNQSDASLMSEEFLTTDTGLQVVLETPADNSSHLQLEQITSLEKSTEAEGINFVEDKPHDFSFDLAQPSHVQSLKEPQISHSQGIHSGDSVSGLAKELEQPISPLKSPDKAELINTVEDKPQELTSDLAQSSPDHSQKEPQVSHPQYHHDEVGASELHKALEEAISPVESPVGVEVINNNPQKLSDLAQSSHNQLLMEPQVSHLQDLQDADVSELTKELEKLELDSNVPTFENIAQPNYDEKTGKGASNENTKLDEPISQERHSTKTNIESQENSEHLESYSFDAVPPEIAPEETIAVPKKPIETSQLIEEPVISQEAEIFLGKSQALLETMEKEVIDSEIASIAEEAALVCTVAPTSSPPSSAPVAKSAAVNNEPHNLLHHIKTIQFKDKKMGIVTQNENGPCPLVAIINVLLLRRQIGLPNSAEIVTAAKLMEHIGDAMLESVPKNLSGESRLNYEQNMMDAMAVLPKLQTGLDVNVKFTGVRDFEYTPECIIFDLLRVSLFHGWLVDPQEHEVVSAIGQAGYNQLVEKVISQKSSIDAEAATQALIIETFLERSASQLTYHGLSELSQSLAEDEIGVLFRNNHFSTIYKHQSELFQLVTDQGFLGETNVVWETLDSIDGDGQFVDCHFRNVPPKPESRISTSEGNSSANISGHNTTSLCMTAEQQIDHDFLVALSLQEEQKEHSPAGVIHDDHQPTPGNISAMSEEDKNAQEELDLALARQLQEEEERQAAEVEREATAAEGAAGSRQSEQQSSPRSSPGQSSKNKCTFL